MRSAVCLLTALLVLGAGAPPALPIEKVDADMQAAVDAHKPAGMSIAILIGGKPSLTKQVTAAAVMQLVDAGKVSLDAPLSAYVPSVPHAADVTIRQLLALRSGLPEYLTGPLLLAEVGRPVTQTQLVARIQGKPLSFKPGSQWQHSNTNYLYLGMLVTAAGGEPYQRYVGDWIAWDDALSSGRVVTPSSYAAMTSGGFPFFNDTLDGQPRVWHDGSTIGFSTFDQYFPKQQLRVIVFTNDGSGVADALGAQIFRDIEPSMAK